MYSDISRLDRRVKRLIALIIVGILGVACHQTPPVEEMPSESAPLPDVATSDSAVRSMPQTTPFQLTLCDAYDTPMVGVGWRWGDPKPEPEWSEADRRWLINADFIQGRIRIDGLLNELPWNTPSRINGFYFYDSGQGEPERTRTSVRFLRDELALYIGVECIDERLPRSPDDREQVEGILKDDAIIISFDPEADFADPYAMRYLRIPAARGLNPKGLDDLPNKNAPWEYAITVGEGRWYVEIAIKWWGLHPTPDFRGVWPLNITRIRSDHDPHGPWTPFLPDKTLKSPTPGDRTSSSGDDIFERNSAWRPIGGVEGRDKNQMPRIGTGSKFTEFLLMANELSIEGRDDQAFHLLRGALTAYGGRAVDALAMTNAFATAWQETKASVELELLNKIPQAFAMPYGASDPGPRRVLLSVFDRENGQKLRQSPVYTFFPTHAMEMVELRAARGEQVHGAFVLTPINDINDLEIKTGNLFKGDQAIFSTAIRVRSLEPTVDARGWRLDSQGLRAWRPMSEELNDALTDRDTPFDMTEGQPRLFWITVDVADVEPGLYQGNITLSARGNAYGMIPVEVRVEDIKLEKTERPVFGVWQTWNNAQRAEREMRMMGRLGVNYFYHELDTNEHGAFQWGRKESALMQVAHEMSGDMALTLPTTLAYNTDMRTRLLTAVNQEHQSLEEARLSFVLDDLPFGGGLYPVYQALKSTCLWARRAAVIHSPDPKLKDSVHLIDDWLISAGSEGFLSEDGPLGQILRDPELRPIIDRYQPQKRFLIAHQAPNSPTVAEAVNSLRASFWYAWKHGLGGVVTRLDERAYPTGPSAQLQALADGAEDYALLKQFQRRLDELTEREDLREKVREAWVERMTTARDQALEIILDESQRDRFVTARDLLFDALLSEDQYAERYPDKVKAKKNIGNLFGILN